MDVTVNPWTNWTPDCFRSTRANPGKSRQLFEFCLVLKPERALLADSIDAISQQYYDGWRLTIFASTPSPRVHSAVPPPVGYSFQTMQLRPKPSTHI